MNSFLENLRQSLDTSELVATLQAPDQDGSHRNDSQKVRAVGRDNIKSLESQGNRALDWSLVRIRGDFSTDFIWNNRFLGPVVLGRCTGKTRNLGHGPDLPSGIFDSTLNDVELGDEVTVHRVGYLGHAAVGPRSVLVNCSTITNDDLTLFGCGTVMPLGLETGQRQIRSFPEIDVNVATQLTMGNREADVLAEFNRLIDCYLQKIKSSRTIIAHDAAILYTDRVAGSYIGPFGVVSNANLVSHSALLSTKKRPSRIGSGVWLRNSIVQHGAEVDSQALVDSSVLCKCCRVERQAKVSGSLIGPNSEIGVGEVTASLVGPFVSLHHQALLIAALWPGGKGNVGQGANVGSNHTGRAPDQELWCGEGTFFGLGVNVKFPVNMSQSPHSILASGVICPPQKIEMPFALINNPIHRHPPDSLLNEIFPGWVLSQNAYALKRNEQKYRQRDKLLHSADHYDVLRPEIVDMMIRARDRLASANGRPNYTSEQIAGLGKNFVTEEARLAGIAAYECWIDHYALNGLRCQLALRNISPNSRPAEDLLEQPSDDLRWEHQREILSSRHAKKDVPQLMRILLHCARRIATEVEQSKVKDDRRGGRIIPDYAVIHATAQEDPIVRQAWLKIADLEDEIGKNTE